MPEAPSPKIQVVVATTAMLTFISVWRAAAVVLSDLASSAYYAGGIAEATIGKSAPWFILAIMLFGFGIRAIYLESSSMFVRGGVYRVVQESLGGTMAKLSVSALMFDYVLTGPISGVSAGLYLAGLMSEIASSLHEPWHIPERPIAAGFALAATIYFWLQNRIGIRESSEKALRIMVITTIMVVILIGWCVFTIARNGYEPVPLPVGRNLRFGPDALGWLEGTFLPNITFIAVLIGLGHSLLAMSGFETLAQIYRELQAPKLQNLRITSFTVIMYALIFTSSVAFFAVMLIPDAERPKYLENLIGGISMYLAGPVAARLIFHVFVVLVGMLILAGAINTAMVGSNGVLNRVAEDGVLPDWFRHPHPRYGTTTRILNLIVILQVITILLSRGNVVLLGEAYAFGVIWSFAMKSLGVLVLRYKYPRPREWKVPINFRIGRTEIPLGLIFINVFLFLLAIVNLLTKKMATIFGSAFTAAFFIVFWYSERHSRRRREQAQCDLEKFRLDEHSDISLREVHVRPGNVLVYVSDANQLDHLERVLAETNPAREDVVAVTVHRLQFLSPGNGSLAVEQVCSDPEVTLLSRVVSVAERAGKRVSLLALAANDPDWALVQAARKLRSSRIVVRQCPPRTPEEQALRLGYAWEQLPEPRPPLRVEVLPGRYGTPLVFSLGPHDPRLWAADINLMHHLWRELTETYGFGPQLHHRDVVGLALQRMDRELHSPSAPEVVEELRQQVASRQGLPTERE